ncbi:MAG: hypothetical protein J6R68_03975, partial [Clostridia bacterium]|nr:hypothetical protein [Clostridia bacterium]
MKTNKLAGGGICAALCVVFILLASFLPTLKLTFLFASSIVMAICLLRYKFTVYLATFIAVSILSL